MAMDIGSSAPAPTAWTTRATTNQFRLVVSAAGDGAGHEQQHGGDVEAAMSPGVGQAAYQWHSGDVAEQVAGYRPGCAVEFVDLYVQIQEYLRAGRLL